MSNSYFQFKQFRIEQSQCAMKVSTDACIQGAWTHIPTTAKYILDIGAGTGLLSLMLAQRNKDATIDAIEMDATAAGQANDNIAHSLWKDRIHIVTIDARAYTADKKYDLIISNPPFFQNSLLGPTQERNMARHTLSLTQDDLLLVIDKHLSAEGSASVMLPMTEQLQWEEKLKNKGWGIAQRLMIHAKETTGAIRVISICKKGFIQSTIDEKLAVRKNATEYTDAFIRLLHPFYLHL